MVCLSEPPFVIYISYLYKICGKICGKINKTAQILQQWGNNQSHSRRVCCRKLQDCRCVEVCSKRDSNPHGRYDQRILSPSCLPFHHSSSRRCFLHCKVRGYFPFMQTLGDFLPRRGEPRVYYRCFNSVKIKESLIATHHPHTLCVMNPLDLHELLLWTAIVAVVLLSVITGRYINRFLTYRAHRRALDELRRRAIESAPSAGESVDHLSSLSVEVHTKA